jgi:hypothetical protein
MRKAFWLLLAVAGCTTLTGGPKPIDYDAAAVRFDNSVTAAQAAAQLAGVEAVLISTTRDSVFVRELATQLKLVPTRPGRINDQTVAFLAGKPEGDTTLTLKTASGGSIRMHDALYKLDKFRWLDLMTVVVEPNTSAREVVRTLLNYIATDVKSDAFTAMAIHAPNGAVTDSIAQLTRAAWADVTECMRGAPSPSAATMRLFYFPPARVHCESARTITGGTAARLILDR